VSEPLDDPARPRPVRPRLTDDPIGTPPSAVSAWNIANALTVFRLVLVPVFVVALFASGGHSKSARVVAFVIFTIASITDRIDGDLARKRGLVTEFGKLADPIADKALIGAALIGLSIGVTLLRFWVIRHGVIPASRGGKLKTLLQGVATGWFVLVPVASWIKPLAWTFMVPAVIVALVTGADYVARAVRLRRAAGVAPAP
jgi:CDP-diacylglycerol---glycerol-3-phosphate 3-phosphatidyltransferase